MIIPVKCFTCGNVIGNKYLYYVNKVIELKKDKNINNENIQYLTNEEMDKYGKTKTLDKSIEGQVLDELKNLLNNVVGDICLHTCDIFFFIKYIILYNSTDRRI